MKKISIAHSIAIVGGIFLATPVFAHVVVKPSQVGIAAFQTFTIGVPVEKEVPTVGLKLIIPEGLQFVTPNVKPGWNISVKKSSGDESAVVTEINWTGGKIPSGQRDEFMFSAQVPAKSSTLQWKAYQTYQDGSVVSWDQAVAHAMSDEDKEAMEKKGLGPLSETAVVNDLALPVVADHSLSMKDENKTSKEISLAALALSVVALLSVWFKKKTA